MLTSSRRKILALVAACTLFIGLLFTARITWITLFSNSAQPAAINGLLDLRDTDFSGFRTVKLDGEWEFYPHTFLFGSREEDSRPSAVPVEVPGGWKAGMQGEGGEHSYGYGSYRLRMLVHSKEAINYSLRISSVRSSSELYVNNRMLMKSGQTGRTQEDYRAWNVPYTVSFPVEKGHNEIEIVIQAANYLDPRASGIVRSIQFGPETAIAREVQMSSFMQLTVTVVLLLHSGYALMLYILGTRERKLLYYAVLTFLVMAILVLSSEEKLLQVWFLVPYEWSFKLLHLFMIAAAMLALVFISGQLPKIIRRLLPVFYLICAAGVVLIFVASVRATVLIQGIILPFIALSACFAAVRVFRSVLRNAADNIPGLFSGIALAHHLAWWTFMLATGLKVMYYPIDLLLAIGLYVGVWFNKYYRIHIETRRLADKLQRADKRKDTFLANTSHELRNPLHGIMNISQAVLDRERSALSDRSVEDLGTVMAVGRRMAAMLNDLLDVMQLKEGLPRLQMKGFYVQGVPAGIFDLLRYMTEGKPVRLVNRIPDDLPQVWADENRVVQIMFNLLHNAVKFTSKGEIVLQAANRNGRVYITISDTGIGMDEETVRRVFEPYEQGDAEKTMIEGGFGLGLSISAQLAELHGGELQLKSELGEGSSFTFSLAVATVEQQGQDVAWLPAVKEAAVTEEREETEPLRSFRFNRPRVLVVDDDPVNCKVLETVLSVEDYEIGSAANARQVLAELEKQEWDLIISDVMMPHMSGYELTREIRQRYGLTELPVLLLTARSRPEDIEEGFRAGANDYISKPVEALELRSRVRMLTEVKQSVRGRIQMETAWLQAQIQPHFLFNSLNAISALSEIDLERMRRMLDELGQLLRRKFRFEALNDLVPIEEELETVRSYLYIEGERFDERLTVEWNTDDCGGLCVPPLTIQPLVENAVRHGIMKRDRGGTITITVARSGQAARITVSDDGIGMDPAVSGPLSAGGPGKGVGLANTDIRLKRHFGSGLNIESSPGAGTSVSFLINSEELQH